MKLLTHSFTQPFQTVAAVKRLTVHHHSADYRIRPF